MNFYFTNNIFNKRIFTSLKNLAFRKSKNKDRINNFDKTPSELSLKNKKDTNSIQTKNTRKYYISNQTINFYESETVPNSKKNDDFQNHLIKHNALNYDINTHQLGINKITKETLKAAIKGYAVNSNGDIAVLMDNKTINIYTQDGVYLYGYSFNIVTISF